MVSDMGTADSKRSYALSDKPSESNFKKVCIAPLVHKRAYFWPSLLAALVRYRLCVLRMRARTAGHSATRGKKMLDMIPRPSKACSEDHLNTQVQSKSKLISPVCALFELLSYKSSPPSLAAVRQASTRGTNLVKP